MWFYTRDEKIENTVSKKDKFENITETKNIIEEKKIEEQENNNSYGIPSDELNFKGSEIVKYKPNSRFTIHSFFSYIMVSII